MPEDEKPEQLALMQQMVDMAARRTKMATERTEMASDRTDMASERTGMASERTEMATERTRLATERTEMAVERTKLATERTEMAAERTEMAAERTEMATERTQMATERTTLAAERTYLAAERTLSVWVRTALGIMVFGIAIDRFGLLLRQVPSVSVHGQVTPNQLSTWGGIALVALSVLMVSTAGLRYMAYAIAYRREHAVPLRHGPFLAPIFALMVALFGVGLLILLVAVLP